MTEAKSLLERPLRSKGRFEKGEKVLCYEPDASKVKVIYEAKILSIRVGQDEETRKRRNEYLVHFQGWNSSWDRYVLEDLLLKDNEENRKQQESLDQEAVNIQKNSQKKKKAERRLSDKNRLSGDGSEEGSFREGSLIEDPEDSEIQFNCSTRDKIKEEKDIDTLTEPSESPCKLNLLDEIKSMQQSDPVAIEEPEDVCTEILPINLPDSLKRKLEHDYTLVNSRRKLVKLPAQPNIICILENFVRHFAVQKLAQLEKQLAKSPYSQFTKINSEKEAEKYDEALNHINICKEVAEGVRIIIDFQLGNILLYRREEDQFSKSSQIRPLLDNIDWRVSPAESTSSGGHGRKHGVSESDSVEGGNSAVVSKKRTRLSVSSSVKEQEVNGGVVLAGSVGSTSSGTMTPTLLTTGSLATAYPQSSKSHIILEQLRSWKLIPDTMYLDTEAPVQPSLVYGGIHLARLMVKIPEILFKMRFSAKNAKRITKYLEWLTDFINNQPDIFADSNYQ